MLSPLWSSCIYQCMEYAVPALYRLREEYASWVDPKLLSINLHGMSYLKDHMDQINWKELSSNPSDDAVHVLLNHTHRIDWVMFCLNTNDHAVDYLLHHPHRIEWTMFCRNSNNKAVTKLLEEMHDLLYSPIASNPNDRIVSYFLENERYITDYASENGNPRMIEYLLDHPDLIDWPKFSRHPHPRVVQILFEDMFEDGILENDGTGTDVDTSRVDWTNLCLNPHERVVRFLLSCFPFLPYSILVLNPNPAIMERLCLEQNPYLVFCSRHEYVFQSYPNPEKVEEWVTIVTNQ